MLAALASSRLSAQPGRIPRIVLTTRSETQEQLGQAGLAQRPLIPTEALPPFVRLWRFFFEELDRRGYVEGVNIIVDRASTFAIGEDDPAGLERAARAIINTQPDAIVTRTRARWVLLLKELTQTIPLVVVALDPLQEQLLTNLARPEANLTGYATRVDAVSFNSKLIQMLVEVSPRTRRVAWLINSNSVATFTPQTNQAVVDALAAEGIAVGIVIYTGPEATDGTALEGFMRRLIAEVVDAGYQGVLFQGDIRFLVDGSSALWARLLIEAGLPAISAASDFPRSGGLLSYTADTRYVFWGIAEYVDRILSGAAVADLPFQTPSLFNLAVNLRAAAALGLTFPIDYLATAAEIIE